MKFIPVANMKFYIQYDIFTMFIFRFHYMILPLERHAISSDEKFFKIPANIIDFDWRPVKFF